MKFEINTQDLCGAILTVTKALSARSTVPVLEGIYIEASTEGVLLQCTDLALQIETRVAAEVDEEGSIVLPGRLFTDIVRRLPGETTRVSAKQAAATIQSGRSNMVVQGYPGSEFHIMPPVKEEFSVRVREDVIKNMIRQSTFATAQDDTRPILTGVLMEIGENSLSMVALDGFRLALLKSPVAGATRVCDVVAPARALLEISRILEEDEREIKLAFSSTHVLVDLGHTSITTRLLDGEFIKYRQILPDKHVTRVRINRQELLEAIERVGLMAREAKSNLVKLQFTKDTLHIAANSELGKSDEEIVADVMGPDLEIAFNAKYFTDILRAVSDTEVYLDMNTNTSPCVIHPLQGEQFYYLVLPVRLYA